MKKIKSTKTDSSSKDGSKASVKSGKKSGKKSGEKSGKKSGEKSGKKSGKKSQMPSTQAPNGMSEKEQTQETPVQKLTRFPHNLLL